MNSISDALLEWLFKRQRFLKPGLERMKALLKHLNNPDQNFDVILVGGTNGKGSTAQLLSAILRESGKKSALFTSPHLTYFSERFLVDGEGLEDEYITEVLKEIKPFAEELEASFFEIVTALACVLFAKAKVNTAVFEVGMGGRFDATNALEPIMSIITNVSHDHRAVLGDTVEKIALDKAGILRPNQPCITFATGSALDVIQSEAEKHLAEFISLEDISELSTELRSWDGLLCSLQSPFGTLELRSPLIGGHQAKNIALAVVAGQYFGVKKADIQKAVAKTVWAGRLEPIITMKRRFLLDGAHNVASAEVLVAAIEMLRPKSLTLIFGASEDKDIAGIFIQLERLKAKVIFTKARLSPKSASTATLQALWQSSADLTENPKEALALALALSKEDDVILIAGSLYLIGEIRPLLLGRSGEAWERWQ